MSAPRSPRDSAGREPSPLAVALAAVLMVAGLAALVYGCIAAALWIGQWA